MTNKADETCPRCPHLFEPHIVVATTGDPMQGGVIICQVKNCGCFATWGADGKPTEFVPNPEQVDLIRDDLQHADT